MGLYCIVNAVVTAGTGTCLFHVDERPWQLLLGRGRERDVRRRAPLDSHKQALSQLRCRFELLRRVVFRTRRSFFCTGVVLAGNRRIFCFWSFGVSVRCSLIYEWQVISFVRYVLIVRVFPSLELTPCARAFFFLVLSGGRWGFDRTRRATCRGRLATRTGMTSPTRSSTTRVCGSAR